MKLKLINLAMEKRKATNKNFSFFEELIYSMKNIFLGKSNETEQPNICLGSVSMKMSSRSIENVML